MAAAYMSRPYYGISESVEQKLIKNIHPLSASKVFSVINDSEQFSDIAENDDKENDNDDENNNID